MRPGAVAVGGYYPTPDHLAWIISQLVHVPSERETILVLDPVAGEGTALSLICRSLKDRGAYVLPLAIELEKTRHEKIFRNVGCHVGPMRHTPLNADAFCVSFEPELVSVLFLNPPYDHDREFRRLEERFLARFYRALLPHGVLLFVVPHYALDASAETLGKHFDEVQAYRFPAGDFEVFKQVVVVARRRPESLSKPDTRIVAAVTKWSIDPSRLPVLGKTSGGLLAPGASSPYMHPLKVNELDVVGLMGRIRPWETIDRLGERSPISGVQPEASLARTYPLATPPRPAHIAAGIAAGIFNGAEIAPETELGCSPILVKGVFNREFRTVDRRYDKNGELSGEVQVQQPRLVTTALDLRTFKYSTVKASTARTEATSVSDMTMADLLHHYGRGMMDVMLDRCPVMHDPARPEDVFELPKLARPLYKAQAHAVMATVKLLGGPTVPLRMRRKLSAFVLGEVGTGKSSVAIAISQHIGAKRTLVMCPPHLLTSWCDQVRLVAPWIRTVVLDTVRDVDELADDTSSTPVVAVLSRETAKLGHAVEGVARCPKCNGKAPDPKESARKRLRCEQVVSSRRDGAISARFSAALVELAKAFPDSLFVREAAADLVPERLFDFWSRKRDRKRISPLDWAQVNRSWRPRLAAVAVAMARRLTDGTIPVLELLLLALDDEKTCIDVANAIIRNAKSTPEQRRAARRFLLLTRPTRTLDSATEVLATMFPCDSWKMLRQERGVLWQGLKSNSTFTEHVYQGARLLQVVDGKVVIGKDKAGDLDLVHSVLVPRLNRLCVRGYKPCGEPLFQAIPEPRRFPLATYIARRTPKLFDFLVLDESHELSNDESAQSRAGHRLKALGMPTVFLTGTLNNGYAESLFANMWAASAAFREEFSRGDKQLFVDRYGYRKQLVEVKPRDDKKKATRGAMSDRVDKHARDLGSAPGILPLFVLKHLLPIAVTLHKSDLAIDVPKCVEHMVEVEPSSTQSSDFRRIESSLRSAIKRDMFDSELSGKLWGAMAELPSYFDCASADVGNTDEGVFELRYPESVGGKLVARAESIPASVLLPKEAALLEHLRRAFAEDRNVLVFAWHVRLLPRLARLIKQHLGEVAPILEPSKVPTAKRETWINETIVFPKRRVLLANPVTVQTGLNNLVHFADEWWHENPGVNGIVYRQAVGRVDRIGQKKPTRIVFPVYQGTVQATAHRLLLHKVGVSQSVDGLDAESAMSAAGIGEQDDFSSFAVGRQLYELLQGEGRA